ncbi:MAG: SpoIIE family protein phosphatase [Planctomycetota bacterium]|nr:SpoIIE family protein phosphatase [Planctomycetota bacterium]
MTADQRSTLLLLGTAEARYGAFTAVPDAPARTHAALSVGSAPLSVSRLAKGRADIPNEDAVLAVDQGVRTLLAVADSHFGHLASHVLLERLRERVDGMPDLPFAPASLVELLASCVGGERPEDDESETTLTAAVIDRSAGRGLGVTFGDSSLFVVSLEEPPRRVSPRNRAYVSPFDAGSFAPGRGALFEFPFRPGDLVVAFTDGVDECHYRNPETSIGARHLHGLFIRTCGETDLFVDALMRLALGGVDGSPGGEDNIALAVTRV